MESELAVDRIRCAARPYVPLDHFADVTGLTWHTVPALAGNRLSPSHLGFIRDSSLGAYLRAVVTVAGKIERGVLLRKVSR